MHRPAWTAGLGGAGASSAAAAGYPGAAPAADGGDGDDDDGGEEEEEVVAPNGLESRRRLRDEYRIAVQNDMNRRHGRQMHLSRAELNAIVGRLADNLDPENEENCEIM
jgi:hypothetical protein